MWEASHSDRSTAAPPGVWALWEDPGRWPEWNEQIERGELTGELAEGGGLWVKFRRGGTLHFDVVRLEPGSLLALEARLPGARLGHEHRVRDQDSGAEIAHRVYVRGPLSAIWAVLIGRRRMRESVRKWSEAERKLLE